jgi:regulator of sigma E protease
MILKILFGLLGLGIVVFIHELGHFLMAKFVGIDVEVFSVGWGRKLFSYTFKGTEYRLSLLPLGGYCRLKGEDAMKAAWESGSEKMQSEKGTFFGVSPWRRILVAASGPVANFIFAVFAFSAVWLIGFSYPTFDNRIILESDFPSRPGDTVYPATQAGLLSGDYIISINGRGIETYRDIQESVAPNPGKRLTVTYRRDGQTGTAEVTPLLNKESGAGRIGVYAWIEPSIEQVRKDSAAFIAGLKSGDRILQVNEEPVHHSLILMKAVHDAKSAPLLITFERNGTIAETRVLPHTDETGRPDIGVSFRPRLFSSRSVGIVEALQLGIKETRDTLGLTIRSLGLLFQGINLSQAVSGPLRITYYVGEAASRGFSRNISSGITSLLNFLSLLSVALFFMNLLPIPALDGGLILLSLYETVRGKSLNPKFIYRYQYVGIFFIFLLIILSTMSDMFFFFRR